MKRTGRFHGTTLGPVLLAVFLVALAAAPRCGFAYTGARLKATGIVIDARGIPLRPAMAPRILDEEGNEVYGARVVDRWHAIQQGMCGYSKDLTAAMTNSRVGASPLVVKALAAEGAGSSDVVVSAFDAQRLRDLEEKYGLLSRVRVMVVLENPSWELPQGFHSMETLEIAVGIGAPHEDTYKEDGSFADRDGAILSAQLAALSDALANFLEKGAGQQYLTTEPGRYDLSSSMYKPFQPFFRQCQGSGVGISSTSLVEQYMAASDSIRSETGGELFGLSLTRRTLVEDFVTQEDVIKIRYKDMEMVVRDFVMEPPWDSEVKDAVLDFLEVSGITARFEYLSDGTVDCYLEYTR
ncbi:MAG: hypothetical protein KKA60_13565 [Proteobacteria bacterium]|nr:hypothetical protein [Pseudomonadota bacterium]